MIDTHWLTASAGTLMSMGVSALGVYIALLLFTRLAGLRSFSKMSGFDFAITVASGSILASTILGESPALLTGVCALALLYAVQYLVAAGRRRSSAVGRVVDNEPLVLMAGDQLLSANLDTARVTEGDINSKLRMAGVTHRSQVLAVILERTGDVAVLKQNDAVDERLFTDVRDGHHIPGMERARRGAT